MTKNRREFIPLEIKISNRRKRKSLTGFTLIELLVVIAIIALLMAILMPALQRAKRQARMSVCQSNLKQWGVIWLMYTNDNNGFFPRRWNDDSGPEHRGRWIIVLYDYYSRNPDIRCCPEAQKIAYPTFPPGADLPDVAGGPFLSWGILNEQLGRPEGTYGSYGINGFAYVPVPASGQDTFFGNPISWFWKTPNVKGAAEVPLFLDCWFFVAWPRHTNTPPTYDGEKWMGDDNAMQRFCLNRHKYAINGVFLDYSVSRIKLKQLWELKWSKGFDTHAPKPAWPDWMKD